MSKANLEQILEMLLAEDTAKAEELLHEYVVAKAREQYERVLDESEDLEEMDHTDSSEDYRDDVIAGMDDDEDELEMDMTEDDDMEEPEMDDMEEPEMDDMEEPEMDDMEEPEMDDEEFEGDDDVADKVDSLEDELEDLRAEFEKLLSQELEEPNHDADDFSMDDEGEAEDDEAEVEFDDDQMESVEEATQFSKTDSLQPMKGATLKGSEDDSSSNPNMPKPASVGNPGKPVHAKDGGEGKKNHSSKEYTPADNTKVKSSSKGSGYGAGAKKPDSPKANSPLTKQPK